MTGSKNASRHCRHGAVSTPRVSPSAISPMITCRSPRCPARPANISAHRRAAASTRGPLHATVLPALWRAGDATLCPEESNTKVRPLPGVAAPVRPAVGAGGHVEAALARLERDVPSISRPQGARMQAFTREGQVAHCDLSKDWDAFRLSEALNYHLKPFAGCRSLPPPRSPDDVACAVSLRSGRAYRLSAGDAAARRLRMTRGHFVAGEPFARYHPPCRRGPIDPCSGTA